MLVVQQPLDQKVTAAAAIEGADAFIQRNIIFMPKSNKSKSRGFYKKQL